MANRSKRGIRSQRMTGVPANAVDLRPLPKSALILGPTSLDDQETAQYRFQVTYADDTTSIEPIETWTSSKSELSINPLQGFATAVAGVGNVASLLQGSYTRQGVTVRASQGVSILAPSVTWETPDSTAIPGAADQPIALSGDGRVLIVGYPEDDTYGTDVGKVVISEMFGGEWVEVQTLTASDKSPNAQFGAAVSTTADGNTILIGAPGHAGSGKYYIFVKQAGRWLEVRSETAPIDSATGLPFAGAQFGASVAISGDGSTLAIAAYGMTNDAGASYGAVTVYTSDPARTSANGGIPVFTKQATYYSPVQTLSISSTGNTIAYGNPGTVENGGSVTLLRRTGTPGSYSYSTTEYTGPYGYGSSVSVNFAGDGFAVGSPNELTTSQQDGRVYIYSGDLGGTPTTNTIIGDPLGGGSIGNVVSYGGSNVVTNRGSYATLYRYDSEVGEFIRDYSVSTPNQNIQLSSDGNTVIAGNTAYTVADPIVPMTAEIVGPDRMVEKSTSLFSVEVTYSDGTIRTRNVPLASDNGVLVFLENTGSAKEVADTEVANVTAAYVEGAFIANLSHVVTVQNSVLWETGVTSFDDFPALTQTGDNYGCSVALSQDGSRMVVGAYGDSVLELNSGAVHVYLKTNGAFVLEQTLRLPDAAIGGKFGWSVDISNDGSVIAASAPFKNTGFNERGSVLVFRRTVTTWSFETEIIGNVPAYTQLGYDVAISGNGTTIVAGVGNAIFKQPALVYFYETGTWSEQGSLQPLYPQDDDGFAKSLSVDETGDFIIAGASLYNRGRQFDMGQLHVFRRTGTEWALFQTIVADQPETFSQLGYDVAMSGDGLTIFAGAPYSNATNIASGAVLAWRRPNLDAEFVEMQSITAPASLNPGDQLGYAVALTDDGTIGIAAALFSATDENGIIGKSYVFALIDGNYSLVSSHAVVGGSGSESLPVSIAGDGDSLTVASEATDSAAATLAPISVTAAPEITSISIIGSDTMSEGASEGDVYKITVTYDDATTVERSATSWESNHPSIIIDDAGNATVGVISADADVTLTARFINAGVEHFATKVVSAINALAMSSLVISGPDEVEETLSTEKFLATVTYENSDQKLAGVSVWSTNRPDLMEMTNLGDMTVMTVAEDTTATITCAYTENGLTVIGTKLITVKARDLIYPESPVAYRFMAEDVETFGSLLSTGKGFATTLQLSSSQSSSRIVEYYSDTNRISFNYTPPVITDGGTWKSYRYKNWRQMYARSTLRFGKRVYNIGVEWTDSYYVYTKQTKAHDVGRSIFKNVVTGPARINNLVISTGYEETGKLGFAASFDGGETFKRWNGAAWETVDFFLDSNIHADQFMTTESMEYALQGVGVDEGASLTLGAVYYTEEPSAYGPKVYTISGTIGIPEPKPWPDDVPDPFSLQPREGVSVSTLIYAEPITVTGVNLPVPLSITGGEFSVNGSEYSSVPVDVFDGDVITVRLMSSSELNVPVVASLQLGVESGSFTVTTTDGLYTPFDTFGPRNNVALLGENGITPSSISATTHYVYGSTVYSPASIFDGYNANTQLDAGIGTKYLYGAWYSTQGNNSNQDIDIDMGRTLRMSGFGIYANSSTRSPKTVELMVSDDGVSFTSVHTVQLTSSTSWQNIALPQVTEGRHIRLRILTNYGDVNYAYLPVLEIYQES